MSKWKGRSKPPSSDEDLARMARVNNLEKHVKACMDYRAQLGVDLADAAIKEQEIRCLAIESQIEACWSDMEDTNREIARLICQDG